MEREWEGTNGGRERGGIAFREKNE